MFFPIGDDQIKGGAYPLFSYSFIVMNVAAFMVQLSLEPQAIGPFLEQYATIPIFITDGHNYTTLFTSMFLHGSWMHLIGNMLFLWVFADNIEATIGNIRFFIFYVTGGLLASLTHVWSDPSSAIPSLGASGAIAAVMGAYLIMFPHSRVKVLLFLLIIVRQITMPALVFLGIWALMQLYYSYQSFGATQTGGGTAWFAHLGGLIFGLFMGALFKGQARTMDFR